jgi:hypothetical protein
MLAKLRFEAPVKQARAQFFQHASEPKAYGMEARCYFLTPFAPLRILMVLVHAVALELADYHCFYWL